MSRIEFVPESSVYWPIIGLGTRECGVAKLCRDPAVQSEFFLPVSRLKTEYIAVESRGDRGWLSHGLVVTLPISYSLDGGTLRGFTRDMRIAD